MRGLFGLLAISLFLISSIAGCRPSGPTEEMGTVVNKMPVVEGAEEPYVIPELGPSTSEAKETKPGPTTNPDQVDNSAPTQQARPGQQSASKPAAKKASPADSPNRLGGGVSGECNQNTRHTRVI